MRNQLLQGYLIHFRKYREKSYIVHLFTEDIGRVDGVLRQTPPPQYQSIILQASGKSELKNFTKVEMIRHPVFFYGDAFFAGFYLNELLLKLCPLEEPMPRTYRQYQNTVAHLEGLALDPCPNTFLRQVLRRFEYTLLKELGYEIDFKVDCFQASIQSTKFYQFQFTEGFLPVIKSDEALLISGEQIISMQDYKEGQNFSPEQLQLLARLHRQMISSLLGDRPLKSRQLWIKNVQSSS